MKALLWHRLSMQKGHIFIVIIISLFITLINFRYFSNASIAMFALILSATIVQSMYTQDHKVKWELFVNSLPLTKKNAVTSGLSLLLQLYCITFYHICSYLLFIVLRKK